jgi:hypothetical protein
MLYATDGIADKSDLDKAMVGVASIWYEGNPCNGHLLGLGQRVKKSISEAGITGYQFGAVGVSDGISMGTAGSMYRQTSVLLTGSDLLSPIARLDCRCRRDRCGRPLARWYGRRPGM